MLRALCLRRRMALCLADFFFHLLPWLPDVCCLRRVAAGSFFIVDNAAIHKARDIADDLAAVLDAAHVRLNPCELVFAQCKRYLRDRRGNRRFWVEILRGLLTVSPANMRAYYAHCMSDRVF
jgi:hypothetical protein